MNVVFVYRLPEHLPDQLIERGKHLKIGGGQQREMVTNEDRN